MNAYRTTELRAATKRGAFNAPMTAATGALLGAADAFLHPLIILPLFALQVGASLRTIALISAAGTTSWFAAVVCASLLARLATRQSAVANVTAIVRAGAIALLAYVVHDASRNDANRLHVFFLCYVVYSAARGFNRQATAASLTNVLPSGRMRWSVWIASICSGVLCIAAGLIAREVLSAHGPGFPKSFALLFGCAAAALCAAAFFTTRLKEPRRVEMPAPSMTDLGAGISNALAATVMRRYVTFRIAMAVLAGADPFFIVFAMTRLSSPLSMAGVYLAVYGGAWLLSGPAWRIAAERIGNRAALQLTAAIRIVAPLVALILPNVLKSTLYLDHVHNSRAPFYLFAAVFGALGIAMRGQSISGSGYLIEIAPERHFNAYALVANASLLLAAFTPLIAVRIIERNGYERLFLATAIAGLAAVFASGLLGETHARVGQAARTLRPRGARVG